MSRFTRITTSLALLGALAGLAALPAGAGEVYRWVDDDGGIHYTAYPPKDRPSEKVMKFKKRDPAAREASANNTGTTSRTPARQTTANSPLTARAESVRVPDPERCAIARRNLTTLQQNARVRVKGDDGQFRYLNPEEHQERIKRSQEAIQESC